MHQEMHQEIPDYAVPPMDGQTYEDITLHPQPPPADSFPMTTTTSQQGDEYSMRSTPSPSPPSGMPAQAAGRQRSRSGTNHMTMQQLNKKRQRATPEQLLVLEEAFILNPSPNAKMREMIADRIKMTERSVQIWFQNRRAKVKQLQRKEVNGEEGAGAVFYGGMAGSPGMMDHMKRSALMRSNSLGHGAGGYHALPHDLRNGLKMGFGAGPLTPAASPSSSKTVIVRMTIETLSIGPWHRVACTSMDLVCYFSPMEGRFTYYINNSSTGFKIEYSVHTIRSIKMEHVVRKGSDDASSRSEPRHRARISIDLTQPPLFYSEHRGAGGWQLCHDFTQGLVASTILLHTLVGPYELLYEQMSEIASMTPEISSRFWVDEQPQYLAFDEEEHTGGASDRNRRHSTAATPTMPAPMRPASAIPAQFARQHLSPATTAVFPGVNGTPRVRQSFQAHRRTRSRSLPTAVNVSDLALAASQHISGNVVPGMKYGHEVASYYPVQQDMLYTAQTPLRIDTSVADSMSTMDYYRQFTPSSNISSTMTPVEYTSASPASQIPLPSAMPFYEGSEFQGGNYAHSAVYSTENMDTMPALYTNEMPQPGMVVEQFQPQETYAFAADHAPDTQYTPAVANPQWAASTAHTPTPQVTVTAQPDAPPEKDIPPKSVTPAAKPQEKEDVKMAEAE